jgi:hypothetical protein
MIRALVTILAITLATPALPQSGDEPAMTPERLITILLALDPAARPAGPGLEMTIEDVPVLVILDPVSDRMRAMVSIASLDDLDDDALRRVMQANFDTALDARYAIAQGRLWGVFIHPLSPLKRDQLISGLGQTVNLALTYGTLFTGGALSFGGGDSVPLQRDLIDRLLEKGREI